MSERLPKLYTIPAGLSFAEHFAATLLQQNENHPEKLPDTLILLPTRRACRIVREAFLRQSGGVALLLPRLQTLGDIDEDALGLEMSALSDPEISVLDLPPALSPLRRRLILTHLILAKNSQKSPDQALLLADALGLLLDKVYTEGLDITQLPSLVDRSKFSKHWQITLDFLTIISEYWPKILEDLGCIDSTDRRNRLLLSIADHWTQHPPQHPVIAAGSTGSIPATGKLLHVISMLPQGAVILPGLDRAMDEKSWRLLDDTHPQATIRNLLRRIGIDRSEVTPWTGSVSPRHLLAQELMRPAETTEEWRTLSQQPEALIEGLKALQKVDCPTAQDEARVISLIFRHVQHNAPKTAALVTFDRDLARRVVAACARWGVNIDDSAGLPLASTPVGTFIILCAQACIDQLAPVPLLSLLKHKLAIAGLPIAEFRAGVRRLDRDSLRGSRPGPGFEGLKSRTAELQQFIAAIETCLAPFFGLFDGNLYPFGQFLDAHLRSAEALAGDAGTVWAGEDGEAASLFFSELRTHAAGLPEIRGQDYLPMVQTLMKGITVRPAWGTHPRLTILGPLEARLLAADVVILGGLNEGSWPPSPENDPWMSRPMRRDFGLPSPERSIGLSAHDFVQAFCAPSVILTRAQRAGITPTLPSRWLQRLDTVLQAANLSIPRTDWLEKSRSLDQALSVNPITRPGPCPPVEKRPTRLSVTEIETWMRDPYALYAKHVLGLKILDPIDAMPGAADKGTIIHEALEIFTRENPETLPETSRERLLEIGHHLINRDIEDIRTRHFWGVRFDKMAESFITAEEKWRMEARPFKQEITGEMILPGHHFTLRGKADRIDLLKDGSGVAIIDYKTATVPSKKDVADGVTPQLLLEAAMITHGAFSGIDQTKIGYLGYWGLAGNGDRRDITNPEVMAVDALNGLKNLITLFANENTPYFSQPRPSLHPRYSHYTHLARIQEWAVLGDSAEGGEG